MKTISFMRAVGLLVPLFFAASSATALTITHNGFGTGGIITGATASIDVTLVDLVDIAPGTEWTSECANLVFPSDACLLKGWGAGTQNDTHIMQGSVESSTQFSEYVYNETGVALAGYSVAVTGAEITDWVFAFYVIDPNDFSILSSTPYYTGASVTGNATSLQFLFGSPLASGTNPPVVFGLGLALSTPDGTFSVSQTPIVAPIPAAASLFGSALGLLAWIRRRSLR